MYEHKEFPKFIYHKTESAKIVQSKVDQDACGDEWAESPAFFEEIASPEIEEQKEKAPRKTSKKKAVVE